MELEPAFPAAARAKPVAVADGVAAAQAAADARAKAVQFDWPNILPQWERLLLGAASAARD